MSCESLKHLVLDGSVISLFNYVELLNIKIPRAQ